jgi:biopolymer transport protein ExbB
MKAFFKVSLKVIRPMKTTLTALLLSAVFVLAASSAVAQDEPKARSLDELLQMVRQSKIAETEEHRQREADFRRNKANQQAELTKAQQIKAQEERRSEQLEATYTRQQQEVAQKRQQLQNRLGTLNELFGHLTSQAGDTRAVLEGSIVSRQPGLDNRPQFLTDLIQKMNSATQLPSIEEIEQMWFEMQREAVEGGRVVTFTDTVLKPNGEQVQESVTRVGNFQLLTASGKYLYAPDEGGIAEMSRQPSGGFQGSAADLAQATDGFTPVGLDPTGPRGGTFLRAFVENTPSLFEQWQQGGPIGYGISALGAFAVIFAIFRLLALAATSSKVSAQLRSQKANPNNPLGRVLKVAEDNPNTDTETLELKLEEAILKERPSIESGLNLLKIIYMVAPLLGLLGTVSGMITTFQAITLFGTGDPKTMAGGISTALVTTVLGLLVAIPVMFLHTIVNGRAKRVLHVLDEQSAGIVANNAGK